MFFYRMPSPAHVLFLRLVPYYIYKQGLIVDNREDPKD